MPLTPGTRLGPYEIIAPLGAGGMGEVYRARDTRLGRDVAVKVLPQHLSANAEVRARFEREAKTISGLNHPHICTLHDVGRQGETDYLVMELVDGETLAEKLGRGALPPAEVLRLGAQIAGALDRAHRAGVIHRDLKPGNVMLTRSGAKLMDFGLARATGLGGPIVAGQTQAGMTHSPTVAVPLTTEGAIVGTFQYMSPEQLEGKDADARSDLWALGCVLYEMATGAPTFAGESQASLIAAIMTGAPRPMTQLQPVTPPALERIVDRCLEKSPEDRFQSAHDLAFALGSLVAPSSGAASAGGASAPPDRSRRLLVLVLGVAAVAIVGAALIGARMNAGRSDAAGAAYTRVTFERQAIFQARFAPDGQTIVMSAAKEGNTPELFVIRPGSSEPHALGIPGLHLLSISSKGELAVLAGARYLGHHRLFKGTLARMPIEGGAPRPMLEGVREADWSPDGSGLAIIREKDGRDRLEYPVGKVLFETAGYLSDLRFSPKGDRIAFMEHPVRYDDRGTVNTVDLSGKAKVLTGIFSGEEGLTWAADGREVMFSAAFSNASANVYAVDIGGRQRVVMRAPGDMIVFDSDRKGRCLVSREETNLAISAKAPGAMTERDFSWLNEAMVNGISGNGRTLLFTDQSEAAGNNYNACVRGTDGSPIIRLGEGTGADISRDGSAVIAIVRSDKPRLMLYPTGVGDTARLDRGQLSEIISAYLSSDGRHAVVSGAEPGKAPRCYLLDVPGGAMRPVTPPGTQVGTMAPDGRTILARTSEGWTLYDLGGGSGRPIAALSPEDAVIRWSSDSRSVFAYDKSRIPLRVDQVDIATGKRTASAEIAPADRAGLVSFLSVALADDPRAYAYCYQRYVSRLYLAEGAR